MWGKWNTMASWNIFLLNHDRLLLVFKVHSYYYLLPWFLSFKTSVIFCGGGGATFWGKKNPHQTKTNSKLKKNCMCCISRGWNNLFQTRKELVDTSISMEIMLDKFKCVNCVVPLQMLFLAKKDQCLLVK